MYKCIVNVFQDAGTDVLEREEDPIAPATDRFSPHKR